MMTQMRVADEVIIRELRFGDREKAAEWIAANYYDTLVRHAAKRLGTDRSLEAEDVIQSIFILILKKDWKDTEIKNLPAYLKTMAANEVKARFRGNKATHITLPLDLKAPTNIEDDVLKRLARYDVDMIFWKLNEMGIISFEEKKMLEAHILGRLDYKMIAKIVDRTPGGVSVALSNARKKIREYCETNPSLFDQLRAAIIMHLVDTWKAQEIISKHKKAGSP